MAQADFQRLRNGLADDDGAGVIGASVGKRLGSAFQKIGIYTGIPGDNTHNTAHRVYSSLHRSPVDISLSAWNRKIDVYELML
jgi:hypothetical protein